MLFFLQVLTMNTGEFDEAVCPICKVGFEDAKDSDVSTLTTKGVEKINISSQQRGCDDVVARLNQQVHKRCRSSWTNEKAIKQALQLCSESSSPVKKKSRRVSLGPYDPKKDCLFCGREIVKGSHGHDESAGEVLTHCFPQTILKHCKERADDWAHIVEGRIEYFGTNLQASDCVYHKRCNTYFRLGQDIPEQFRSEAGHKPKEIGRPKDEDQRQAFQRVCEYLKSNDEEQITISELVSKMGEYLLVEDSEPYGSQYLKQKLKERYSDSIYIAEGQGLQDIVTMREKTAKILRTYFETSKDGDADSQKLAIIATAAKLLRCDIKTEISSVTDQYPSSLSLKLDATLDYLPISLRTMLDQLFVGTDRNEKVAAIGQSIIQAVRPRALIVPLQIGLAIQLHHLYKSRFLIDTLSEMGFTSSYGEVQRFLKNAANVVAPQLLGSGSFGTVLFAADNVDHNIITLDGKGTFHGMGMVAATTPGQVTTHVVHRENVSKLNVKEMSRVDIIDYRFSTFARRNIMFEILPELNFPVPGVDILWELSFCFHTDTPNWQGMMSIVHSGSDHPGKSSITFLPMIDMYPSEPTCILSTLSFICDLAAKHKISAIVTFDQPLFFKASEIIYNSPEGSHLKNITLMLGSFHSLMNVLGAIGTLMQGSGLTGILETVYGDNAVKHMIGGKAVQRALRGHLLVEKCLNGMLVSEMMESDPELANSVKSCEDMYNSLLEGTTTLETVVTSEINAKLQQTLDKKKLELSHQSRTSKLWVAYMNIVKSARMLLMADRMGSWDRHLHAVAECLPIFAAAGHYNYLKSGYLYLQNMQNLETKDPAVFRKFQDGFHVIRRSDKFWAGLGSDLVIEQTLMKSLKSTGGLTRGSGMSDEQRALWVLSSPVCSEYNHAMEDFNKRAFSTSVQHKEMSGARMKRDQADLAKIKEKLESCSPFSADPTLRNIITGVVAEDGVNVDEYQKVGRHIIDKMEGQQVFTYASKRKDKVKTLGDSCKVQVSPDRSIDPALLFQRLLVISNAGAFSLEEVLEYELSPFPPALFDASYIMRKPDKTQLAKAIDAYACRLSDEAVTNEVPQTESYVLDGGSLMHRIPWTKGSTYGAIADSYVDFTLRNYGMATIVFDGYHDQPSVKDSTHQRRQQKNHPKVSVTPTTVFTGKKEEFLSQGSNKQGLINLISDRLRKKGCTVMNAEGDADYDIVQAAIAVSECKTTSLIGEDTDLLILLLHHMDSRKKTLYFRSDKKSKEQRVYNVNTLKECLGQRLCSQLLFIHAFTGCDTTSTVFGMGKKTFFQKAAEGDKELESCALAFTEPGQTSDAIEQHGNQSMVVLFSGKRSDSLASLRHSVLKKKVVSASSFVAPARLPPTASSTKFHSLRVYYQIMVWLGLDNNLDATDWGWKIEDHQFVPVMTAKNAAPDNLLQIVHCNCTTACTTQRCTCRRYGLPCTSVCGRCQLESCENPNNLLPLDQDDTEVSNDDDYM
jgi:hypothetical protein